jgi:hypothetical protein
MVNVNVNGYVNDHHMIKLELDFLINTKLKVSDGEDVSE